MLEHFRALAIYQQLIIEIWSSLLVYNLRSLQILVLPLHYGDALAIIGMLAVLVRAILFAIFTRACPTWVALAIAAHGWPFKVVLAAHPDVLDSLSIVLEFVVTTLFDHQFFSDHRQAHLLNHCDTYWSCVLHMLWREIFTVDVLLGHVLEIALHG